MAMRITPQAMLGRQLGYLRRQADSLAVSQEQISSGLKLQKPSDGPLDLMTVLAAKSEDGRITTNQSNLKSAQARLDQGNSALLQVGTLLNQAHDLALQGADSSIDQ